MYTLQPLSDRARRVRDRYREVARELDMSRYKIVTEFYQSHPELTGIMRRALNFRNLCDKMVIRILDDEVIVGALGEKFCSAALYPENGVEWMPEEFSTGRIETREADPYIVSDELKQLVIDTAPFWNVTVAGAKGAAYVAEGYAAHANNGFLLMDAKTRGSGPYGHFCSGYRNILKKGFKGIHDEADAKMKALEEKGIQGGEETDQYHFYHAVRIVTEGMIAFTLRHADLARQKYEQETDEARKAELLMMATSLEWLAANPARTFYEALQAMFLYHIGMCLDANLHGISWGRVDQYLYPYYAKDTQDGTISKEYAQELLDLFYLKVAEMNKPWSAIATLANPGYTSGQLMTLGGVDAQGNDATNEVTFMMLQAMGRLELHDPPQSLRIHRGTPAELWEAALETTKMLGGVPTYQSDEAIIPALMNNRGFTLEDARDYCLIGCIEPGGCGNDWPAMGGTCGAPINMAGGLLLAMNNGINPMSSVFSLGMAATADNLDGLVERNQLQEAAKTPQGLPTGYLYEMETFDEFVEAFRKQIVYFLKWAITNENLHEPIMQQELPQPLVSCAMDGCMESGKDVMYGGSKYSGLGFNIIGLGNAADGMWLIKYLCFDEKICTTRELYDAVMANWEGYEELRSFIRTKCPHFGNGDSEVDKWMTWLSDVVADEINAQRGSYCKYNPGVYPVTLNVTFGKFTPATPDGRGTGDPLADGIAPVQQMDTSGPTALLTSVASMNQSKYGAGTLMNLKIHPNALKGVDSMKKLSELISTYLLDMKGMELQINVVSVDTLRAAQKNPEQYKNLVVRVAGFSTYFVELHEECREDLIRRTEHMI